MPPVPPIARARRNRANGLVLGTIVPERSGRALGAKEFGVVSGNDRSQIARRREKQRHSYPYIQFHYRACDSRRRPFTTSDGR